MKEIPVTDVFEGAEVAIDLGFLGREDEADGADFAIVMDRAGRENKMLGLLDWSGLDEYEIAWVPATRWDQDTIPPVSVQAANRKRMFEELAETGVSRVLLVGQVAMDAWRTDLPVVSWHGELGAWKGKWGVMGVLDPSEIVTRVEREENVAGWVGRRCGGAGKGGWCLSVNWIDPDGIGWCKAHRELGEKMWQLVRDRWAELEEREERENVDVELPFSPSRHDT